LGTTKSSSCFHTCTALGSFLFMMDVQRSRIPAVATEEFGAGEIRKMRGDALAGEGASAGRKMKKARCAVALSPELNIAHYIFRIDERRHDGTRHPASSPCRQHVLPLGGRFRQAPQMGISALTAIASRGTDALKRFHGRNDCTSLRLVAIGAEQSQNPHPYKSKGAAPSLKFPM